MSARDSPLQRKKREKWVRKEDENSLRVRDNRKIEMKARDSHRQSGDWERKNMKMKARDSHRPRGERQKFEREIERERKFCFGESKSRDLKRMVLKLDPGSSDFACFRFVGWTP